VGRFPARCACVKVAFRRPHTGRTSSVRSPGDGSCHPRRVFDLSVPTTRDERRSARRTWAAYPYALRKEVVRAAKRNQRHPHEAAAWAAVVYAAAVLRPTGRHWWQNARWCFPLVLAAAVLMAGEAVWFIAAPGPSEVLDGGLLAVAVVIGLWAVLVLAARRDCRLILAPFVVPAPSR
jgi:hypothetical protein